MGDRDGQHGPDLAALELRRALRMLHERGHADVTVTGREDTDKLHPLDLQTRLEIDLEAAVDGLLGRTDGVCRTAHVTLDAPACRGVHLVGCDDLVHQTDLCLLYTSDAADDLT